MLRGRTGRLSVLVGLALLFFPPAGRAADEKAPAALDLVPEDAAFAVVVRNLAELGERGDKFIEASHLRIAADGRPSKLFPELFKYLGVTKGLDTRGAAAVVVPNFKTVGIAGQKDINFEYLSAVLANTVYVVPFDSLDAAAGNFKLKADDLKPGVIKPTGVATDIGRAVGLGNIMVAAKGKHLYLGHNEKALNAVMGGKPLGGALSAGQRAALAKVDLAVHFGPKSGGMLWPLLMKQLQDGLATRDDEAANEVVRQFTDALGSVQYLIAGVRLEDGLGLDLVASVPPANEGGAAARKFLDDLRAGPGAADLNGLPSVEQPLFLYAAKGDGVRNVHMARALTKIILNKALNIHLLLTGEERKKFFADFDVMYTHLKGSRLVLYRTPAADAEKIGSVAAVGILDISDVDDHLKRWATMVETANTLGVKVTRDGRESAPKFGYKPKADVLDGQRVDLLTMDIPRLPDAVQREYRQLLGPDWNRVRLVVLDQRVVFLIGSDVERLRQAVKNVRGGDKGLAGAKPVTAALARLTPERKLEFHADFKNFKAFVDGTRLEGPGQALSSTALTVEPDRIHLELRVSPADLKALVRALGLADN